MFRLISLSLLAAVVLSNPCAPIATTAASPCQPVTTTQAPCVPVTTAAAPCVPPTTTTTTTTPAPCIPVTTAAAPCEPVTTTTTTVAPCVPVTTAASPCEPITTTTANPCQQDAPTTTLSPCAAAAAEKENVKWGRYDRVRLSGQEQVAAHDAPKEAVMGEICANGWTRFKDSCYYTERENKKTLKEAEEHCREMQSTLFVPNSEDEYKTIFENAPLNTWTWLGLYKASEESGAHWHVESDMEYTKLNWLNNKPYGDATNGWSTVSQCAAHWNPSMSIGKYIFWYPCSYSFHYVCERNATIAAQAKDFF